MPHSQLLVPGIDDEPKGRGAPMDTTSGDHTAGRHGRGLSLPLERQRQKGVS